MKYMLGLFGPGRCGRCGWASRNHSQGSVGAVWEPVVADHPYEKWNATYRPVRAGRGER